MGSSFARSLATGLKLTASETAAHLLHIDGESDRSRLYPQRNPPGARPELQCIFLLTSSCGCYGKVPRVLARWYDDTSSEGSEETLGSIQRTGFSSAARWELHAQYLRSDATEHVQSAVLPTKLGCFPSKTIEFGNHLVFQRAAFHRRKGMTSAVIFLDMTDAFYRALPQLVLALYWTKRPGPFSWLPAAPQRESVEADYGDGPL